MAAKPKPSVLRVVAVQVKQVLGAEEFNVEPGLITVFSGLNESGKTSALTAVQVALGGGSLAKLARVDPKTKTRSDDAEIVLVLKGDGNEEYRAHRKGDKVKVRKRVDDTAAFEDVPRPQEFLSSLFDAVGSNPVRFIMAKDDERALMLLEALDLKYERGDLLATMDLGDDFQLPPIPAGIHPLLEVEMIRVAAFTRRTGVNRDEKQAKAAAEQLKRAAPAVVPGDPQKEVAAAQEEARGVAADIARQQEAAKGKEAATRASATAAHEAGEQAATGAFKAWALKERAGHAEAAAAIRADAERKISEAAAVLEASIDERRALAERAIEDLDTVRDLAFEEAGRLLVSELLDTATGQARLEALASRIGELQAQSDASKKAVTLYDQIRKFEAQAESLETESDRLTAGLAALDAYRRRMAEDLPIAGLEIDGKEIRVDGVPFEQLNMGKRVKIAVDVATLRTVGSRLPIVFVDGAESLDTPHFNALVAELKERGVQAFIARVTDGPFTVSTEEAP